ncbi:unnamed protein product (macronuclear) [Paramecium tetraurelia]|uniref:Uncharacterized protein n=1 Tax=Paramecium tetraurelia TaxID=5888 RepID=A0E7P6_PARTE|nr:uncharacterized protein GSPATT00024041001 [Paramecium tetraurelia]CAK91313.1 unnamed protein product [Paramecium tetraurelia]|eukprot:XP_001458710.1 hypothetical protein (macronuclear) [Paramecium tetraurelia strain d4-2]
MNLNYIDNYGQLADVSSQQQKSSSIHNSHREYTFAPYGQNQVVNMSAKQSQQDSNFINRYHNSSLPPNNYTKKKSPSQPTSYLNKLKQQYAPLQSTQSTHHSNHNQSVESDHQSYEQLMIYNNLLKLELEKKLFNCGVFVIKQNNGKCVDFYMELKRQKDYYENQIQQLQAVIQNHENRPNEYIDLSEYQRQNQELSKSIEQAISKLTLANQTINQLEQEKESLLDYVDKQKDIAEQLKSQNDQQDLKQKEMKIMILQLQKQIEQYNIELMDKEEFIKEISEMQNKNKCLLQDEIMKYQQQITMLQRQLQDYEQQNKDLSRKFNDSASQIHMIIRQSDDKQSQLQFTQMQDNHSVCEFDSNLKSSRNTNLIQKQQQGLDQMIKINKQTLQDFQQQLMLHQKLGEYQEKLSNQLSQIEQQNKQLIAITQQHQEVLQQNSSLIEKEADLNREIQDLNQKIEKLQQERQEQVEQMEILQQQAIDQNQINQDLNTQYFKQIDELQSVNQIQQKYNTLQIKVQADVEYYENIISEFNCQLIKIQKKIEDIFSKLQVFDLSKIQANEISTNTILISLDHLETLVNRNLGCNKIQLNTSNQINNTQLNFSTNQTPTNMVHNSKYFSNECFDSNQKNSMLSNLSNHNKPYLVKRNYYL